MKGKFIPGMKVIVNTGDYRGCTGYIKSSILKFHPPMATYRYKVDLLMDRTLEYKLRQKNMRPSKCHSLTINVSESELFEIPEGRVKKEKKDSKIIGKEWSVYPIRINCVIKNNINTNKNKNYFGGYGFPYAIDLDKGKFYFKLKKHKGIDINKVISFPVEHAFDCLKPAVPGDRVLFDLTAKNTLLANEKVKEAKKITNK